MAALAPAASAFGIDLVHFGLIMVINFSIGAITPPFAVNLFVASQIGGLKYEQIVRPILPYILLLIINVMLLLLGCFMDMAPLITIMTPILLPVVTNPAIGMDPVDFGVVMMFNLAVGLCTPPVGSALFVGCAIGKTPIERTAKNMMPLYLTMVIVLMLVTYIPDVSLLLPRLLMGYGA